MKKNCFDLFGGILIEIHTFKSHQNAIEWKNEGLLFIVTIDHGKYVSEFCITDAFNAVIFN